MVVSSKKTLLRKPLIKTIYKYILVTISIINVTRTLKSTNKLYSKTVLITVITPAEKGKAQINSNIHPVILQNKYASILNFFKSCHPSSPAEIV